MMKRVFLLLSICCCVVCFGSPVKSMLGAEGTEIYSEETSFSASDYVQDGLVAMWDGIENESFGMHNPYAEVWLDLIGGKPAIFRRPVSWYGDALVVAARSQATCAVSIVDDSLVSVFNGTEFTIEVVRTIADSRYASYVTWGLFNDTTEEQSKVQFGESSSGFGGPSDTKWISLSPGYSFVTRSGEYATASTSFVFISGRLYSYYNGAAKNTKGGLDFHETTRMLLGGAGCRIHAIRIYSHAMAAAEITHNYLIDRERFSL